MEEYDSYADCDDHFVRRSLPPGLKPFWAVDDLSEATNSFTISERAADFGRLVSRSPLTSDIIQMTSSMAFWPLIVSGPA